MVEPRLLEGRSDVVEQEPGEPRLVDGGEKHPDQAAERSSEQDHARQTELGDQSLDILQIGERIA
jgi:hypothetical protein